MSVETDPIPPVPEHTPPLKEDEISRSPGKFFNQVWTRWFISVRDKVNVINDSLVNLGAISGVGLIAKNGAVWAARVITGTANRVSVTNGNGAAGNPTVDVVTANLIAGTNVSFSGGSGVGQLIDNGQGNITINATGGGGGGSFSKIAEVTVTSAQQDIDFTTLDLNTARFYQIELYVVPNVSGAQTVSYYFNSDTTNANYRRQLLIANGSTSFASRASDGAVLTTNAMPTTATSIYVTLKTAKYTGVRPSSTLVCQVQDTTEIMSMTGSHVWTNTTNVTDIKLRHSSNFGVGTIARLYTLA